VKRLGKNTGHCLSNLKKQLEAREKRSAIPALLFSMDLLFYFLCPFFDKIINFTYYEHNADKV
jgi:hypothetical protein